jgi:hypothetical protein
MYEPITVVPDSIMLLNTNGNRLVADGVLLDSSRASVYATITDAHRTITFTETPMAFISPGYWEMELPSSACHSGDGPWVIRLQVFGPSGNFDTLYRTIYRLGVE